MFFLTQLHLRRKGKSAVCRSKMSFSTPPLSFCSYGAEIAKAHTVHKTEKRTEHKIRLKCMLLSDQIYKTLHKGCHPLSAVVDDLAEINLRCNADVQLDQSVALYITPD